jgi:hypothetical protein
MYLLFVSVRLQNPRLTMILQQMSQLKTGCSFLIISLLIFWFNQTNAQFVSKVIEYIPAPGQFTNADYIGTPSAANSIVGTNKGLVSLGAFGGSVTVYFADGIKNDPANPYGVDFTVYGNATMTWSELGIIQVMKDENHNGLPDDTWYEIAGSEHFWNSTFSGYQVSYLNNGLNVAGDIHWTDNQSASGIIPVNSFHQQPYYPRADLFPTITADKYNLNGTRLTCPIDLSIPGSVISNHKTFGYADNTPALSYTEKLPDNPYTAVTEGSGGDAIDIGWAVDQNKKPVNLDEIHFIRIYTGMNALAGWLGEVSTEITGIRDVEPANVSGVQSVVVIKELPRKMSLGQSLDLEAIVFESGIRQQNVGINWSVSDAQLVAIENGKLVAKNAGTVQLRAASASNPAIYTEVSLEIFSAAKAEITLSSKSLKVNDKLELSGRLKDLSGNVLTGINTTWRINDETIAEIILVDGTYYLKGKKIGKSWLHYEVADNPLVCDSVQIEIFPESALKKVFAAVKTSDRTIIPRQSVWVEQIDLTAKVDHAQKQYGLSEINYVSLAHAVAAILKTSGQNSDWAFRDDAQGGSALYLWKVPSVEEGSTVYTFGYGGSRTADAYRKTWVVMLNQQPVVTGLDKIKVNNNDEILIYHIADNNLPWLVTQMTTGADSVKVGQNVEVQLKKFSCTMDAERNVAINSSEAVASQSVIAEPNQVAANRVVITTDEFGKALFTASQSGQYLVSSGIDVSRVISGLVTGVPNLPEVSVKCTVFPNPFTGSINVNCPSPISSVEIFNVEGLLVFMEKEPSQEVNLEHLPSGLYIIRIKSGKQVFQQKIVKK